MDDHSRLVWPQWQGASPSSVRELAPEFPFDVARRGFAVGSAVLAAALPPHDGRRRATAGRSFSPGDVRTSSQPLLDWLAGTGCSRVAVHSDVLTGFPLHG